MTAEEEALRAQLAEAEATLRALRLESDARACRTCLAFYGADYRGHCMCDASGVQNTALPRRIFLLRRHGEREVEELRRLESFLRNGLYEASVWIGRLNPAQAEAFRAMSRTTNPAAAPALSPAAPIPGGLDREAVGRFLHERVLEHEDGAQMFWMDLPEEIREAHRVVGTALWDYFWARTSRVVGSP